MHRLGIGEAAGIAEYVAEVRQRVRVVRHEVDGGAKAVSAVARSPSSFSTTPRLLWGCGLRVGPRDRFSDVLQSVLALAAPPSHQAQDMQGVGLVWLEQQQLSARFLGAAEIAASGRDWPPLQQSCAGAGCFVVDCRDSDGIRCPSPDAASPTMSGSGQ
jgi:hypothetical protein